jgi:hypothetical protein
MQTLQKKKTSGFKGPRVFQTRGKSKNGLKIRTQVLSLQPNSSGSTHQAAQIPGGVLQNWQDYCLWISDPF